MISLRQLYAAGEPFGSGATRPRAGGRIYGGGGDSQPQPTQQTVTQTNIPDYARPYVEDMLGRSQALTTQNYYQPYNGQRVANFSDLQATAQSGARMLRPASQLGTATGIASGVAGAAGGMGQYTPGQFGTVGPMMTGTGQWNAQAAQTYMNPYMQAVVDIQKREATRQSDMMGQRQNAEAVGAGAFGGTRHALVEAERQRNLGQQLNDIQAQGANAAWQQAQGMFTSDQARALQSQMANQQNLLGYGGQYLQAQQLGEQSRQFGAGQGLAALNTQLQAANTLGQLGTSDYNQRVGIIGLQNQLGGEMQANQQARLDAQYQDWVNRQMFPYRQLEFQNNILRGNYSPNTTTSIYGGYGSPLSQMAGLGMAGAGMYRMANGMAEGGLASLADVTDVKPKREVKKPKLKSYAHGGKVEPGLVGLLISEIA